MRKFKKNPAVRLVVLPTHGRVYDYDILEGDEYAQYCPSLLVEIVSEQPEAPALDSVDAGETLPPPPPVIVYDPVPVSLPEVAVEAAPEVEGEDATGAEADDDDDDDEGEVDSPDTMLSDTIGGVAEQTNAFAGKRKRGRPRKAHY